MSPGPAPRAERRRAAGAGVLAAALTLGVAQLVAGFVGPGAAPLAAIGEAFVDVTPPWLKDWAIATFGTADKTALLVGAAVVVAALGAVAGLIALRSWPAAVAVVGLLGVVGAVAAGTRADAGPLAPLPSLAGAVGGLFALRTLVDRAGPRAPGSADPELGGYDRRSFLVASGVVAVVAATAASIGSVAGSAVRVTESARERLRLPRPSRPAPAVPAAAQSTVHGVAPVVTPNTDFYRIDTALTVPQVDPSVWTLRVHGLVEREVELSFEELLAEPLVEAYVTLACVSNPVGGGLVGNARWLGLPVRTLLARAGVRPGADMVLSTSVDGFTASTPLQALTDERDALVAVGMNGEPLPLAHGFPVRLVVPGLYGYVSATKWLAELEVTRFADRTAYWTRRGWAARGPVKTSSRIDAPRNGAQVRQGPVPVGGVAWAQHRGVTGVQLQVDDGPWQDVDLADEISIDTWRQWSWRWEATAGEHVLRVRAVDPEGTQTGDPAPVVPDGATGWHEIRVSVDT